MKIETKFNEGDIVYFMKGNQIADGIIYDVSINKANGREELVIAYGVRINNSFLDEEKEIQRYYEGELFTNPKELLNSLITNYNKETFEV